ncbi:hypothetical protein DMN91_012689 [Ooceraea biroi]|uniref:Uncharacterized protein n=1 Tax=Ooceraea biroi TaxID=2015173 RepID=A0A3L8D2S6_OOCBI|nr:hypothetical protein DMN91_012689 [Ooceraea biroi]
MKLLIFTAENRSENPLFRLDEYNLSTAKEWQLEIVLFSQIQKIENPGHLAMDHLFRITPDFTSAFVYCSRVRVVQRRSPLAELLAEESEGGETRDSNFLEEEDRIFSWQEKVFSPFEIDFYADEKNCLTDCQREYHRSIRDEELHGARLYSYTENDSYYADDGVLTKPYRQDIE